MENIKKLILDTVKDAVVEEGKLLTVTVEPQQLHILVKTLHDNAGLPFDYLVSVIGMDWGEKLGVIYQLSSSVDLSKQVVIKTGTADRENPLLYSITDLYETASLNEREVFALFGIRFINHPDMRRFLLNQDWKGFPMRKDYDENPELNPLNVESKDMVDETITITETSDGIKEEKVNIFEDGDYIINIGPQHPSTHGVMHFRTSLDGEIIKKIDVHKRIYPPRHRKTQRASYVSSNTSLY